MNQVGLLGKAKLHTLSKLPSVSVVLTIGFLYYMYMDTFLSRMFIKANHLPPSSSVTESMTLDFSKIGLNKGTVYMLVLFSLFIMFVVSYMRVLFTSPGFVPDTWHSKRGEIVMKEYCEEKIVSNEKGMFSSLLTNRKLTPSYFFDPDFVRFLNEKDYRFCIVCAKFKPERSHHCRQTGKCVLKMDHFCNWLSNCIGYKNYKFFLVFILYSSTLLSQGIILLFITITYTEHFINSIRDYRVRSFEPD
jgi:hypothetical protein